MCTLVSFIASALLCGNRFCSSTYGLRSHSQIDELLAIEDLRRVQGFQSESYKRCEMKCGWLTVEIHSFAPQMLVVSSSRTSWTKKNRSPIHQFPQCRTSNWDSQWARLPWGKCVVFMECSKFTGVWSEIGLSIHKLNALQLDTCMWGIKSLSYMVGRTFD